MFLPGPPDIDIGLDELDLAPAKGGGAAAVADDEDGPIIARLQIAKKKIEGQLTTLRQTLVPIANAWNAAHGLRVGDQLDPGVGAVHDSKRVHSNQWDLGNTIRLGFTSFGKRSAEGRGSLQGVGHATRGLQALTAVASLCRSQQGHRSPRCHVYERDSSGVWQAFCIDESTRALLRQMRGDQSLEGGRVA